MAYTITTGRVLMLIETRLKKKLAELSPLGLFQFKGTVDSTSDLPETGNEVGDVYNIGASLDGDNYSWNGSEWINIGNSSAPYVSYETVNTYQEADAVSMEFLNDGGLMVITVG